MTDQVAAGDQSAVLVPSKKRKRNATTASGPRKPREKPVECPVCLTSRLPKLILDPLACNCIYCVPCIRELFSFSLQSEDGISNYPAQCCGKVLDHSLLEGSLTPQLRRTYKLKVEEMASSDPLYCGNAECGAFILEAAIKDNFGSCSKCKMKTCVKKECNKTKAEHLGIHGICPGELETDDLKTLAEEKGWKRCPKCYVLTERSRGCDDIRCVCRTEWCYKCGKALRGTKDVCSCYPPRVPPPVPPPVQQTQDDLQAQRETIVIDDEDDRDTDIVNVKPSIEGIERTSGALFYTEFDPVAELDRRVNISAQSSSRNLTAQPQTSLSQAEHDFMQELDDLTAPNTRAIRGSPQHTSDMYTTNLGRDVTSVARELIVDSVPDNLEEMLHAFNNYEASSSNSTVAAPAIGLDGPEVDSVTYIPELARNDSSEPIPVSFLDSIHDPGRHDNFVTNSVPRSPHYAYTHAPETSLDAGTLVAQDDQTERITIPEERSVTVYRISTESVPKPNPPPPPSSAKPNETLNSLPETSQAEMDTTTNLDADWLMGSIEEYLSTQGGCSTNESMEFE